MTRSYAILYDPNEITPWGGGEDRVAQLRKCVQSMMDSPSLDNLYLGWGWLVRMEIISDTEYFCAVKDCDEFRPSPKAEPVWRLIEEKAERMLHCTPSGHLIALYD